MPSLTNEQITQFILDYEKRIEELEAAVFKPKTPSKIKKWTNEEVAFLKANKAFKTNSELAGMWKKEFGYPRTEDSIRRKIQRTFR